MRTIKLVKGGGYSVDGIEFKHGVPHTVDDALADKLLSLGKFKTVHAPQQGGEIPGFSMGAASTFPQNVFGMDDLNGKRILLRRGGGIGDTLFALQFAGYVKRRFPGAYIAVAVHEGLIDFAAQFSCADTVISLGDSTRHEIIVTYDYLIPFNGLFELEDLQTSDYYAAHFKRAGLEFGPEDTIPELRRLGSTERVQAADAEVSEFLREHDAVERAYVVLVAGTSNPMKTVDAGVLNRLCRLFRKSGVHDALKKVFIAVGERDKFVLLNPVPGQVQVRGKSLTFLAGLMEKAACVIGGDTGLVHTAAAMGIPAVSLWTCTGPKIILRGMPYPDRIVAVQSKLNCSPCNRIKPAYCMAKAGGIPNCVTQIDTVEVLAATEKLLAIHRQKESGVTIRKSAALDVDSAAGLLSPEYVNVVMPISMTETFTGGGYYAWHFAKSLAAHRSMRVFVLLTTRTPVYLNGAGELPERMHLVYDPDYALLQGEKKQSFQFAVGQPIRDGVLAINYAKATPGCKGIAFVYETPNYIATHRKGDDAYDSYWESYKEALRAADTVIPISHTTKNYLKEWMPELASDPKVIQLVHPIVDNAVADAVLPPANVTLGARRFARHHKTNSIVMCSRNVTYKRMRTAIMDIVERFAVYKSTPDNPLYIHVIGAKTKELQHMAEQANFAARAVLVRAHENCPEDAKWRLIGEAKVLVHPSEFEGFGIPIAEAFYAGTPVLCHPLEVFRNTFAQYPFYYSDADSMVLALHHIWRCYDGDPDIENVDFRHLRKYLRDAFQFTRLRFTAQSRDNRFNTLFALHYNDQEKAEAARAERNKRGEVVKIAYVGRYGAQNATSDALGSCTRGARWSYRVYTDTGKKFKPGAVDSPYVIPNWESPMRFFDQLRQDVSTYAPDIAHVYYEPDVFALKSILPRFLTDMRDRGIRTCVTAISGYPETENMRAVIQEADAVIVPERLVSGNYKNVFTIPLPVNPLSAPAVDRQQARTELGIDHGAYVVGIFGMPDADRKEVFALLDLYPEFVAGATNKTVMLASCYTQDAQVAETVHKKYASYADSGKVRLFTKWASMATVEKRLVACDVVLFNYLPCTGVERIAVSSSMRVALACGVPVVCTDSVYTREFSGGEVIQVPYTQEKNTAMVSAAVDLLHNAVRRDELSAAAKRFVLSRTRGKYVERIGRMYNMLAK